MCVLSDQMIVDERVSEITLRGGHRTTLTTGALRRCTCDHHDHYHHHHRYHDQQCYCELPHTQLLCCAVAHHQNSRSKLLTTTSAVTQTDKLFLMRYLQ